ncbi:MAG TPA: hypothetical protein VEW68_04360 [Patescibacteria group bacterium]|nr:hypothetical protein [Patescibacteria group bacterium]
MSAKTAVYLEVGAKRSFASAADWPGWSRGGKGEEAALAALAAYAPRYAAVAKLAGLDLPASATDFEVVERQPGNASTDYGVPGSPAKLESRPVGAKEVERLCRLVEACWSYLDQVRASAPQELRKGPRGGGRDRDAMFDHVLGAEIEYAKRLGIRLKQPDGRDSAAVRAFRQEILAAMRDTSREQRWPLAYFARRAAWHALDHAWEMEDRIP